MKNLIDAVIEEAQNQAIAGHRRPPLPLSHTPSSATSSAKVSPTSSSSPNNHNHHSPYASIASQLLRSSVAEASMQGPDTQHAPGQGLGVHNDDDDSVPTLSAFKGELQRATASPTPLADSTAGSTSTASPTPGDGSQPLDYGGVGPNGEWLEFRDPSNGAVYYVNMISGAYGATTFIHTHIPCWQPSSSNPTLNPPLPSPLAPTPQPLTLNPLQPPPCPPPSPLSPQGTFAASTPQTPVPWRPSSRATRAGWTRAPTADKRARAPV